MGLRRFVESLRLLVATPGEQYLDVRALLAHQRRVREDTTTANVGAFAVPLGGRIVRDPKTGAGDVQGAKLLRPPGYVPPVTASGRDRRLRRKKRRK